MKTKVRKSPCRYCPYRRDVPSGVWHESEYAKLECYDAQTGEQPMATFRCHESSGAICCGWAQCHGYELLALRMAEIESGQIEIPKRTTPIFNSGRAAAMHGMARIFVPGKAARKAIRYVQNIRLSKKAQGGE